MELKVGLICKDPLVKCKLTGKDRAAACLPTDCTLHSTKLRISVHSSFVRLAGGVEGWAYL